MCEDINKVFMNLELIVKAVDRYSTVSNRNEVLKHSLARVNSRPIQGLGDAG